MYSIVAGVVSFWIPAIVMVYVYIRFINNENYETLLKYRQIFFRVYMEAVKLESLQFSSTPAINNLQIAQEKRKRSFFYRPLKEQLFNSVVLF